MEPFLTGIIFLLLAIWSPQTFFLLAKKSWDRESTAPRGNRDGSKLHKTVRGGNNGRSSKTTAQTSFARDEKNKMKVKRHLFDVMRDKISSVQRKGYKYYLEVLASGSSEFECACIKATRPNNDPPKEKYVSSIIAAVNNFDEINEDSSTIGDEFDPYELALHKLWFRIANKRDFRTKLKALNILHRLWSSVQLESAILLKKHINALSIKICKRTGKKYFTDKEASNISTCIAGHSHFEFLQMYSKYVLFRCRSFSPSFEESILGFQSSSHHLNDKENVGKSGEFLAEKYRLKVEQLNDILLRMKKLLLIVSDFFITASAADEITSACFSLIKKDIQQLYSLFEERLAELIAIYEISNIPKNKNRKITAPEITEVVENPLKRSKREKNYTKLCKFYIELSENMSRWSSHHSKMFRIFEDNDYNIITEKSLSVQKVTQHLNVIENIH